ncbi:hypothetical protein [Nocardia sp. NPDC057668]|uniref:hypothetical protein n=1 Tax=Nocardia sp. NPDC057668 TaxID=3346202 RepID=UPI00366D6CD1
MPSPFAESLRIDQADALSLATAVRAHGRSLEELPAGQAAAGVAAGFAGFRLGTVCAARSADTDDATAALGRALELIGGNTVRCVDAFHHTDHAVRLNIVDATTHLPNP